MNIVHNYKNLNNNWYIIIKKDNQDFQSIIPPNESFYADRFTIFTAKFFISKCHHDKLSVWYL